MDHPATQAAKRELLATKKLAEPETLEFIPCDFEKETLAEALAGSTYSREKPAFFSWMGTVPYLSREAVFGTLGSLAGFARPGSEIVFDYLIPKELLAPEDIGVFEMTPKFFSRRGEPLLSFFDPRRFPGEVCGLGFELVENLSPRE